MSVLRSLKLETSFGPFRFIVKDFYQEWNKVRTFLLPSIEFSRGTFTEDSVLQGVLNKETMLVLAQKSALVFETPKSKKPMLHYILCGGYFDEIKEAEAIITQIAKDSGFAGAFASGRRGWLALPGYKEVAVTLIKEF